MAYFFLQFLGFPRSPLNVLLPSSLWPTDDFFVFFVLHSHLRMPTIHDWPGLSSNWSFRRESRLNAKMSRNLRGSFWSIFNYLIFFCLLCLVFSLPLSFHWKVYVVFWLSLPLFVLGAILLYRHLLMICDFSSLTLFLIRFYPVYLPTQRLGILLLCINFIFSIFFTLENVYLSIEFFCRTFGNTFCFIWIKSNY